MIYSFINDDNKKALDSVDRLVAGLLKKRPETIVYSYDSENFSIEKFSELASGSGLFSSKDIIVCRNVSVNEEAKNIVEGLLSDCKKSDSIFIFWETGLDKTFVKSLEKYSETVKKADDKKDKEFFNAFALADALTLRDRQKLWVLYQKGLMAGQKSDDLLRTLIWQVKTMILVSTAQNGEADDMKPYPRSKALAGAKKYKPEELQNLFFDFVESAHKNYPDSPELEMAIEKTILNL